MTRPADAAGLVLLRDSGGRTEVLLGRRHGRAGFLPDIYVFPGGRVDQDDSRPTGFGEFLHPHVLSQLRVGSRIDPLRFARAAVRETFEETGLMLAAPGAPTKADVGMTVWREFFARGCRPRFEALDFICRAITPTYSKRRYNTRFFLADGSTLTGEISGDGELEDLGWRPVDALDSLTIVDVTQFVLAEALRRWRDRAPAGREPARLFCYRGDQARWRIPAYAGTGDGRWRNPSAPGFARS